MSPRFPILLFAAIAFFGALALAIAAQILWMRYKKKRRRGFPVEPPTHVRND